MKKVLVGIVSSLMLTLPAMADDTKVTTLEALTTARQRQVDDLAAVTEAIKGDMPDDALTAAYLLKMMDVLTGTLEATDIVVTKLGGDSLDPSSAEAVKQIDQEFAEDAKDYK